MESIYVVKNKKDHSVENHPKYGKIVGVEDVVEGVHEAGNLHLVMKDGSTLKASTIYKEMGVEYKVKENGN